MFDTIQWISHAAAILTGLLVGAAYFGGLWWTVDRMPTARNPLAFYLSSLAMRSALALFVFYLVLTSYGVARLMLVLAAFLVIRIVMVAILGRTTGNNLLTGSSVK